MSPERLLLWSFLVSPILFAVWLVVAIRSRGFTWAVFLWLLLSGSLAASGFFHDTDARPPRMLFLIAVLLVWCYVIATQHVGKRIAEKSAYFLIGVQAFRLPLELMIHNAVELGVAPPQMTWSGMNFDILTGATALLLSPFANRLPLWAIWSWNLFGTALLINVFTVAALSIPGPLQVIKPDNIWVTEFPYFWLPAIFVLSAATLHVALFRKLLHASSPTRKGALDVD